MTTKRIKALTKDTVLGRLTVWFGPGAIEWVEFNRFGPYDEISPEIYAQDQLNRFLRGGKLDADVEVLDVDDKVPDRWPEGHPLNEPRRKGTYDHLPRAKPSSKNEVIDGDALEDFDEYEPVEAQPLKGDRMIHVDGGKKRTATANGVGDPHPDVLWRTDDNGLGLLTRPNGKGWRILKRKLAEAEGWETPDGIRRVLVGNGSYYCHANEGPWRRDIDRGPACVREGVAGKWKTGGWRPMDRDDELQTALRELREQGLIK